MKALLLLTLLTALARGAERVPNIVFIRADDLGITDINAYARHFNKVAADELYYETPHLDRLVADGIAFSQSYANQLCSPTRAAILSGRIASRMGLTTATPNTKTYFNQGEKVPEGYSPHDTLGYSDKIPGKRPWSNGSTNTGLDLSIPTWPRVMATHDCAFLGKWHLGGHGVPELQPAAHGFEELAYFDAGKWSNAVIDCTDFLPTVAELTGNTAPAGLDGRSMLPLLIDPASTGPERTLIWHYPFNVIVKHPDNGQPLSPHSAIRVGDHKLVWDWHGKIELYHIPADPKETHDLSNENPELAARLHQQLKQWLKQNVAPRYWAQRDETLTPEAAAGPFPFRDLRWSIPLRAAPNPIHKSGNLNGWTLGKDSGVVSMIF